MLSVFNVILISNLMHENRRPAVALKREVDIYPAVAQMLVEWAELVIEIAVSVQRANDLVNRDILQAGELSVWALLWCLVGEYCQFSIFAHQFCPEGISPGICSQGEELIR